jgi:hypothetical protein
MTVRYLAQELYRLTKRVEELEHALAALGEKASLEERRRLEAELHQARRDRDQTRGVLQAKKEKPLL